MQGRNVNVCCLAGGWYTLVTFSQFFISVSRINVIIIIVVSNILKFVRVSSPSSSLLFVVKHKCHRLWCVAFCSITFYNCRRTLTSHDSRYQRIHVSVRTGDASIQYFVSYGRRWNSKSKSCNTMTRSRWLDTTYSRDGICIVSTVIDLTYRWSLHQNKHNDRGSSTFISCDQFNSTLRMLSPRSCGFGMTTWYLVPCSSRAVPLVMSMPRNAPRSEWIDAVI